MEGAFCCPAPLTKHPETRGGILHELQIHHKLRASFKNAVEESIYRLKKKKALKQLERNRKSSYYKDNGSNNWR